MLLRAAALTGTWHIVKGAEGFVFPPADARPVSYLPPSGSFAYGSMAGIAYLNSYFGGMVHAGWPTHAR